MREIILRLEQFDPAISPGGNVRPSEMILMPLLEIMAWMNCVQLATHPNIMPLYEYGRRGQVRYLPEPPGVELFNGIKEVLREGGGDCFPQGTLVLTERMELVPVENLWVGAEIWGQDAWSTVEARQFKGMLPVDAIHMNNGSTVCLTPDHHVYVLRCPRHDEDRKTPCTCTPDARVRERVRVAELRPTMVLAQPARIPFGSEEQDPERAYIEGLYISDGWSDRPSRFAVSGQDGKPKEKQKREVERICQRLGIHTRWHRKYIAVNDGDWALRMQRMGGYAPKKHALSINLTEGPAIALLRGIMADSGRNTNGSGRTFTTTSRRLTTQVRLLHKMCGVYASYRYIEDHGGLGTHPIHRLGVRDPNRQKLLRVKSITRRAFEMPCWDIQTSDHRVYLPEHDVTVSQCDDLCAWRVSELRTRGSLPHYPTGEPASFVILKFPPKHRGEKLLYHIQVRRAPTPDHTDPMDPFLIEDPSAMLGMPVAAQLASPPQAMMNGAPMVVPFASPKTTVGTAIEHIMRHA